MVSRTEYKNNYQKEHYDRINPQSTTKPVPEATWLSSETKHQLDKWQVPKKYYHMISSLTVLNGLYTINLLDGYINDTTGTNKVEFRSVAELRAIMKQTHKA